jgi:hypothetical protein
MPVKAIQDQGNDSDDDKPKLASPMKKIKVVQPLEPKMVHQ